MEKLSWGYFGGYLYNLAEKNQLRLLDLIFLSYDKILENMGTGKTLKGKTEI